MQNTKKQNNVIIYIDCYERCEFFIRLATSGIKLNYNFIFLTDSITSYALIKKRGFYCKLIKKYKENTGFFPHNKLEKSLNVINKEQTLKYANIYANSVYNTISNILDKITISYIFIWNGSNTAGLAIKKISNDKNIRTIFFEISNLPNKLFIDINGVNAESFIYKNISMLESLPSISDDKFEDWKKQWWHYKLSPIPQSIIKGKFNNNYYIDRLYSLLPGNIFCNEFNFQKKVKNKKIKIKINNSILTTGIKDYIFLPLQVSSDSQLKINSEYNNIDAIAYFISMAENKNLNLVVKIHPAEYDSDEIDKIINLKNKLNFYISNENTNELIKNAEYICVINSTVGLEAMILNKKVHILGRAIYSNFNLEILKKYIFNWLINIDYFSQKEIDPEEFTKIIKMANDCYDN